MSFTIKHRESDALGGTEYLYSANDIMIVRKGDHFGDGIYLDPEPPEEPVPVENETPVEQPAPQFSRRVILFGGDQTTNALARCGGKVWIMNEGGNTVAAYDL